MSVCRELSEKVGQNEDTMRERLDHTVKELLECYETLNLLFDLGEALHGKLDPEEVARIAVETIAEGLGIGTAALFTATGDGGSLILESSAGRFVAEDAAGVEKGLLRSIAERAFLHGSAVIEGLPGGAEASVMAVPTWGSEGATGAIVIGDRLTGEPFSSGDQKVLITAACHVDAVIEDSHLYAQVKDFNKELERRVEDTTAKLEVARDQLLRAERTALVGQLAVTMNHEINNPLSIILGTCQMLSSKLEGGDTGGLHDGLARVEESARIIAWKVNRLRDVVEPVVKDYIQGVQMIDIERSIEHAAENGFLRKGAT